MNRSQLKSTYISERPEGFSETLLLERAYFRGGHQITVADTDLGKLGMIICWDALHSDLWAQYAGNIDAMVIMSCGGNLGNADLVFPDGFCVKFSELTRAAAHADEDSDTSRADELDKHAEHAAWMRIPVVHASATGVIRTKLPLFYITLPV